MTPVENSFLRQPEMQATQNKGGKRLHDDILPLLDNAEEGLQEPFQKKPKLAANGSEATLIAKHQAFCSQFSLAIELVKCVLVGLNDSLAQEDLSMRFYNA